MSLRLVAPVPTAKPLARSPEMTTAWQRLKTRQWSCDEALHILVNWQSTLNLEALDPELSRRFQQDLAGYGDDLRLIPLLLWQGVYYLGSPDSLSDERIQALSARLGTAIQVVAVSPESMLSYGEWFRMNARSQSLITPLSMESPMISRRSLNSFLAQSTGSVALPQPLNLESQVQELILYQERLDAELLGSEVYQLFKQKPLLPGIIITQDEAYIGMVARQRFYEHITSLRYSIDVFRDRPIRILHEFFREQILVIPGHTRIFEAAQLSLQRLSSRIYEPIVVEIEESGQIVHQLLDVHQLLLAQGRVHELIVEELSTIKKSLELTNSDLENRVYQRTLDLETSNRSLRKEIQIRQSVQEKLHYLAYHDSLTKLPNRLKFMDALAEALSRAQADPGYQFGIILIDFDRFKLINDSLGRAVGDQVLGEIATRLKENLHPDDLVARLGGDEFIILGFDLASVELATSCAEQIQQLWHQPLTLGSQEVYINASLGLVLNSGYTDPEEMIRDANVSMHQAKLAGKGCYRLFESSMQQQTKHRLLVETDLHKALERHEFNLVYQPIVNLASRQIVGFEALIRWHHPQRGSVSPVEFISIAEENGMIVPLGYWVIQEACKQLRIWQAMQVSQVPLRISVNLSVRQFIQADLMLNIHKILTDTPLDGAGLTVEITESAFLENSDLTTRALTQLQQRHIQISIDDFGTGYSSLSYLHRFPVNNLKIDQSFVRNLTSSSESLGIVKAIIALTQALGMSVTAEGIETQEQADLLQSLGCNYGQGYYFSRPLNSELAEEWVMGKDLAKPAAVTIG